MDSYFALIERFLRHAPIQFRECAMHLHYEIFIGVSIFVVQCTEGMTEDTALLNYFLVQDFGQHVVRLEKFLKYFIRIIAEPIPSFEFALHEQTLFQFIPTMLVIERAHDWIAENLVCFRNL